MIKHLRLNKALWSVATALAMGAATYGLFNNGIYDGLMPKGLVAAQFAQDILTILVGLLLFVLIIRTNEKSIREPVIISGILGSLAYLYAIFSIERVYNVLYLLYLAILSVAFYTVIYTISSFRPEVVAKVDVPKGVRTTTAVFSLVIAALFTLLWVGALLPLMKSHEQIDNLYSIYLLDLAVAMPAFIITAVMTFRRKPMGYLLTPAMFILGIFVIFPLGLGELAKPLFNLTTDYKSMTISFVLAGLFCAGAVWQLGKLKLKK